MAQEAMQDGSEPARNKLLALAAALAGAILLADLRLPLGASVPSLYAAVVLLGLWSPARNYTVSSAAATSVLTVLGAVLSPSGPTPWTAIVNRPTAIMVIWLTALGVQRHQRSQAALLRQRTLASLGELAAIVAHEVRNPLAGIRATLQVLSKRLPGDEDERTLQALFERIDALDKMTEDLLLFARPRALHPISQPLKTLVREAADLLARDKRAAATLVEIDGDDAVVNADPQALRGVFLNLLLNAAEAMGGAGTVRVTVGQADGSSVVAIRDSGPGIPSDLRDKIFEPFFTTKHRGTGLGLSIVQRQLELHGGSISVSGADGTGATVTVRLPRGARA